MGRNKILPSDNFGKSLNIAIDHLLSTRVFAAGLLHDDEPMLVVAAGKQRRHLRRCPVAEIGSGFERGIRSTGPIHPGPDRRQTGRIRDESHGLEQRRWRSTGDEVRARRSGGSGGGEETICDARGGGAGEELRHWDRWLLGDGGD